MNCQYNEEILDHMEVENWNYAYKFVIFRINP